MQVLGPLVQADVLRYCIESTGTYHMPVLRAWEGIPCVVNPLLKAGATPGAKAPSPLSALPAHSILSPRARSLWRSYMAPAFAKQ